MTSLLKDNIHLTFQPHFEDMVMIKGEIIGGITHFLHRAVETWFLWEGAYKTQTCHSFTWLLHRPINFPEQSIQATGPLCLILSRLSPWRIIQIKEGIYIHLTMGFWHHTFNLQRMMVHPFFCLISAPFLFSLLCNGVHQNHGGSNLTESEIRRKEREC